MPITRSQTKLIQQEISILLCRNHAIASQLARGVSQDRVLGGLVSIGSVNYQKDKIFLWQFFDFLEANPSITEQDILTVLADNYPHITVRQ